MPSIGSTVASKQILRDRNHQLDLLRIIFATMVLLGHASELSPGQLYGDLFRRWTHSNVTFGAIGVDGFFLLSGFLIVQSWENNPELMNFLRKRALRIVPGYFVAVVLSTLVVGIAAPAVDHFFRNLGPEFAVSILFLSAPVTPAVFPGLTHNSVNGSLWTIPYEFRCYLFVAFCGMVGLIRRRRAWLFLTIALLLVVFIPLLEGFLKWNESPFDLLIGNSEQDFRLTATYCLGGSFYLFRHEIPFRPMLAVIALAILGVCIGIHPINLEPFLVVLGAYLMFYVTRTPMKSLAWMKNFPDISYGIYLYGWPVESLWIWYRHGSSGATFFFSTAICFGLGWLSWHFVERPMLKLKSKSNTVLPGP